VVAKGLEAVAVRLMQCAMFMRNFSEPTVTKAVSRELNVRLTIPNPPPGMELFTPNGSLRWRETRFHLNPPAGTPCDFWMVHSYAWPEETAVVCPVNTLFINGEPSAKRNYARAFYRQFQHVVSPHAGTPHPNLHRTAPCLGWLVGFDYRAGRITYGYDHLKNMARPEKQNLVAVVCSDTAKTRGQRERLAFLAALKRKLGDRLVHFGKGFAPVDDKMTAISPYRYQLVLENSISEHYWTEKIMDAYLGWAFPLYCGCPNLADYFPGESFLALDWHDAEGAVRQIEALLDTPTESWLPAVAEARRRVLEDLNPFGRFHELAQQLYRAGPAAAVTVRHYKAFQGWRGLWTHLRGRTAATGLVPAS
jgi:hypothetical protein